MIKSTLRKIQICCLIIIVLIDLFVINYFEIYYLISDICSVFDFTLRWFVKSFLNFIQSIDTLESWHRLSLSQPNWSFWSHFRRILLYVCVFWAARKIPRIHICVIGSQLTFTHIQKRLNAVLQNMNILFKKQLLNLRSFPNHLPLNIGHHFLIIFVIIHFQLIQ